jgi:hypothetical protein
MFAGLSDLNRNGGDVQFVDIFGFFERRVISMSVKIIKFCFNCGTKHEEDKVICPKCKMILAKVRITSKGV